ncbi:MauE/DoxX family redox-associated membrane protein [Actinomadura viridis]|uniref:MauE/DoxX family redox-associated membrane protein n=1 Tax=Actinomadura viridis TaxID=58110 RepID=UPI0036ACB688
MAPYLMMTLRAIVAGTFLISMVGKLRARETLAGFVMAVRRIGRVPDRFAAPVAAGVIVTEAGVVVLLAVPGGQVAGFAMAAAALVGFTVVLMAALRRGLAEPCRCFGKAEEPIGRRHVVRNGVLFVAAAAGAVFAPGVEGVPLEPAVVLLCLLAASAFVACVVLLDDLLFLFR